MKPVKLSNHLLSDLRALIADARQDVARRVNSVLVILYWKVGKRVRQDILKEKRAGYGEEIVSTLSRQLVEEFGNGFSRPNLFRMVRFAEVFPEDRIVSTLSRQLSWSHFVEIIPLKDDLQRDFYAEMCRVEHWSVRTLRQKIAGMLFERTALSKKPAKLAKQELAALREEDKLTPDLVFRDPYFLNFLGLKDTFSEKDMEAAILRELEGFILELGVGFTFVARQKRITVDHSVTSKSDKMGLRYRPMAFTEQGVAMLSSVLRSDRAIEVNIAIMRVFVKLRHVVSTHKELAVKLRQLERKIEKHDESIEAIFEAIRQLMTPPEKPRKRIGFDIKERRAAYGKRAKKG